MPDHKHLAAEETVVVNYASSKEGADRVVDEIASAGVGRSRYRQMLLKSRGRTSFLQRRTGIRQARHLQQCRNL